MEAALCCFRLFGIFLLGYLGDHSLIVSCSFYDVALL